MVEKEIISISIEEIKKRWMDYCVKIRQYHVKNKDYKDLQYIDELIVKGLDNDIINTRLERYRKIRITNESLNKKREEFNKRMSKPSKRIELSKKGKLYLHHFDEELEDNLYYNQKVVWCNSCGRTHRINSNIAWDHSVRPIPVKCEVDEDHCWKYTHDEDDYLIHYFSGADIVLCASKNVLLSLVEAYGKECIVCGKKGLQSGITILPYLCLNKETKRKQYKQLTVNQFDELYKLLQSIKDLGFDELNKITGNQFKGNDISFEMINTDIEIRKIQHIEDFIIIE